MIGAALSLRVADSKGDFQYSTDATDLATGAWSGVPALNFVTPNTVTVGAKNGNAAAERTAVASTIASIGVASGATVLDTLD